METTDRDRWIQQVLTEHTPDGLEPRAVYLRCRAGDSSRAAVQAARTAKVDPDRLTREWVEGWVERVERDPYTPGRRYLEAVREGDTSTGGGVYTDTLVLDATPDPVTAPLLAATPSRAPSTEGAAVGVLAATLRDLVLAREQSHQQQIDTLIRSHTSLAESVQRMGMELATVRAEAARQQGYTEGRQAGLVEGRQAGEDEAMSFVDALVRVAGASPTAPTDATDGAPRFDAAAAVEWVMQHAPPGLVEWVLGMLAGAAQQVATPTPDAPSAPTETPEESPADAVLDGGDGGAVDA